VILALIITALIAVVSLQTFAFGSFELEKLRYRRQALALLDGEMEYWRARFRQAGAAHPVAPAEGPARDQEVEDRTSGLIFRVHSDLWQLDHEGDLPYQDVEVQVSYRREDLADTVTLRTRHYVR
jgi:hypothetical protein